MTFDDEVKFDGNWIPLDPAMTQRHPSLDVALVHLSIASNRATLPLHQSLGSVVRAFPVGFGRRSAMARHEGNARRIGSLKFPPPQMKTSSLHCSGENFCLSATSLCDAGPCDGDSGGPLLAEMASGSYGIVGLIVESDACERGQSASFVRPEAITRWLTQELGPAIDWTK